MVLIERKDGNGSVSGIEGYMQELVDRFHIQSFAREEYKRRFPRERIDITFALDAFEIYSISEEGLEIHNSRVAFVYENYKVTGGFVKKIRG